MADGWGKILLGTRLEKYVDGNFVGVWSALLTQGMRPGDGFSIVQGHMLHKGLNELVRHLLKSTADTLATLDSDADITDPTYLEQMRNLEAGWKYDALQAFYVRRGWPPEAIWFKRNVLGDNIQCIITAEGLTEEVSLIGTHCALFRRHMFEHIYEVEGKPEGITLDNFEWFHFPRHQKTGEDGFFSTQMAKHGYKMGATTAVKVGHRSMVTTGWETYQEYLRANQIDKRVEWLHENIDLVAEFTGQEREIVEAQAMRGNQNVENVNRVWNDVPHGSAQEVREFYGRPDNGYFYDLISWNSTPFYLSIVEPLEKVDGKDCLVIGAGIGGEVQRLIEKNRVTAFELPGVMKDFLKFRFNGTLKWIDALTLQDYPAIDQVSGYDLIVAIDVIEHVHPDELRPFLQAVKQMTKPEGYIYFHNNFSQQNGNYPQHYDHAEVFDAWLNENYQKVGERQWQKR
jgi:2-polyprenyl-3-methyl-5-hydroxy-6-metoxy-1,4-benzoquinol methylase